MYTFLKTFCVKAKTIAMGQILCIFVAGNSNESELFNSLKAHINNRNRLQPFVGGSISLFSFL